MRSQNTFTLRNIIITILLMHLLIITPFVLNAQGSLVKYDIGDFITENKDTIINCKIGSRTFGKPDSDHSNTLLILTWFGGKSVEYSEATKPGNWADSTKYYVIIIDALGGGISSSPSNSQQQKNMDFPEFSIRDMVNTQHILLTKHLGIDHVYAIGGYSMGGFQAYQWMVSYPDFMDKAFIISGTPKPDPFDKEFYQANLDILDLGFKNPEIKDDVFATDVRLFSICLSSPDFVNSQYLKYGSSKFIQILENYFIQNDFYDWTYQMKALFDHDIYLTYDIPEDGINKMITADCLMIVNSNDRIVNPGPSIKFSKEINADLHELKSNCGHFYYTCEKNEISEKINEFLIK